MTASFEKFTMTQEVVGMLFLVGEGQCSELSSEKLDERLVGLKSRKVGFWEVCFLTSSLPEFLDFSHCFILGQVLMVNNKFSCSFSPIHSIRSEL